MKNGEKNEDKNYSKLEESDSESDSFEIESLVSFNHLQKLVFISF